VLSPEQWLTHRRSTWVWADRFVPYPFQLNLHRLPEPMKEACVRGLLEAASGRAERAGEGLRESGQAPIVLIGASPIFAGSFRDWILATFGRGIAEQFMLPYNQKLWAHPLERMSCRWIRQRVAVPEVEEVLRRVRLGKDSKSWGPNATFRYPRRGGAGAVWTALARALPPQCIRYGEPLVRVDADRRVVHTASGSTYGYDHLINTMPLDQLAKMLDTNRVVPPAETLAWTATHVIGIGCEGQPSATVQDKLWVYYPGDSVPFYRVTVQSNLSAENTPRPGQTWSLMAEVSESPYRRLPAGDLVQHVIDGFRSVGLLRSGERIVSRWYRRLPYGYPVPTLDRDQVLDELLPFLRELGIYSRGRFGAWKYEVGNQDHSFMQGVEAVEHILHGRTELTLEEPDLVNSRHNPFPYREWEVAMAPAEEECSPVAPRPDMAGFGESRLHR
jgi:protoporphyrinogen oxidase